MAERETSWEASTPSTANTAGKPDHQNGGTSSVHNNHREQPRKVHSQAGSVQEAVIPPSLPPPTLILKR